MKKILKVGLIILIIFAMVYNPNIVFADSDELVEITFAENNMYNTVCAQLGDKIAEKDDSKRIIKISSENLNNIKTLSIKSSEIAKISGIEKFTALEELDISNNNIKDISAIASLTNLRKLDVHGNDIQTIDKFENLVNLVELNISRNNFYTTNTNLENLSTLTKLEKLDLSHTYIRDMSGIGNLTSLKELNLYNDMIYDYTGIDKLQNLEYLNLGANNERGKLTITDESLALISNLTNLKYLNVSENKNSNIVNYIGNLTNLEYLSLENNSVTDISNIENLTNLKTLILYNNSIKDISVISKLTKLEELNLAKNAVEDLSVLLEDEELVLPNLKKIDIFNLNKLKAVSNDAVRKLWTMSENKELEVNYEPSDEMADRSDLPHYDGDIAYVTYDDFGARADGVYDDFIAMRNAHHWANDNNCEVRGVEGKTYHIFKYYEDPVTIKTNVDWKNSTIVIHDENIEDYSGRFKSLFNIKTINQDVKDLKDLNWTGIGKSSKKIEQLQDEINALNEKGYEKYFIHIENANHRHYIRSGADANDGTYMQDNFVIDKDCNILDEIQWDFEQVTQVKIMPLSKDEHYIRNVKFLSNPTSAGSEVPITRASGKGMYMYRNLNFNYCDNMTVSNIKHEVPTIGMSGSYVGLIYSSYCQNFKIEDCLLHSYKYTLRSTYDLNLNRTSNLYVKNIDSNYIEDTYRWGVMGSNYCKYVVFENCTMNRIDAHCGFYNLTVKDCHVGSKGLSLIGQGDAYIINTKISANTFCSLRSDYGATWDGNMYIIDCTYDFLGTSSPLLFRYDISKEADGSIHDYGYPCKFPNVYIENLTMDFSRNKNSSSMFLILRTNVKENETDWEEWYKPEKFVVNGFKMIQGTKPCKIQTTKYRFDNFDLTYQVQEGMTVGELKELRDENITVKDSEGNVVDDDVELETGMRLVLTDKCDFVIETISDRKLDLTLTPSVEEVSAGEEFDVTVRLTNVKDIKEGLVAVTGTLDYDSDKLEIVGDEDSLLEGKNGWNFDYYQGNEFKFVADNRIIKEDTDLFTVKFKVKENVEEGKANIEIKNFAASGGQGEIEAEDAEVEINIVKKEDILIGDIDGNGKVELNDLAKLKLHLIEKELIVDENKKKAADTDQDGKISLNDLARLKLMLLGRKE